MNLAVGIVDLFSLAKMLLGTFAKTLALKKPTGLIKKAAMLRG